MTLTGYKFLQLYMKFELQMNVNNRFFYYEHNSISEIFNSNLIPKIKIKRRFGSESIKILSCFSGER